MTTVRCDIRPGRRRTLTAAPPSRHSFSFVLPVPLSARPFAQSAMRLAADSQPAPRDRAGGQQRSLYPPGSVSRHAVGRINPARWPACTCQKCTGLQHARLCGTAGVQPSTTPGKPPMVAALQGPKRRDAPSGFHRLLFVALRRLRCIFLRGKGAVVADLALDAGTCDQRHTAPGGQSGGSQAGGVAIHLNIRASTWRMHGLRRCPACQPALSCTQPLSSSHAGRSPTPPRWRLPAVSVADA